MNTITAQPPVSRVLDSEDDETRLPDGRHVGLSASGRERRVVLVLGSGPDAVRARDWERAPFTSIVAINNAWQIRSDWNYLIHPEDFPPDRWPPSVRTASQTLVKAADYVPVQNAFGGFVYAGGTMAFTAAYWALGALRPDVMAFLGCDMVYEEAGPTHFYGRGAQDPLRADVTLQSLEAKSLRFMAFAAQANCLVLNLSQQATSRLVYPRCDPQFFAHWSNQTLALEMQAQRRGLDVQALATALGMESALGYMVASGRYWEVSDSLDADKLSAIDQAWLAVRPALAPEPARA